MEHRPFGPLGMVSALTLGGGGTGQVWGPTTREEAVATTREAVEADIDFLDVAPGYGNGEAERVVGEAFDGRLPPGVRVSTKCRLNVVPALEVFPTFEASLAASLERLRLERVDLFLLHNQVVTDEESAAGVPGTPLSLFDEAVRPAFERLVADGRIGAWGITGIGSPAAVLEVLRSSSPPAAVHCVTNLLDSPGSMQRFEGDPRPREIIAAAVEAGAGVMGIRAVQAGALTDAFDRDLADDHPDMRDYRRAASFRALAAELDVTPALLAHRYALTMPGVSTVVLGVKNRDELRECLAAEALGPLAPDLVTRVDASARGA